MLLGILDTTALWYSSRSLFMLPSAAEADYSVFQKGLVSKRWLIENVLAMTWLAAFVPILCELVYAAIFSEQLPTTLASPLLSGPLLFPLQANGLFNNFPRTLQVLSATALAFITFVAGVYTALLVRVVGDFAESAESVPTYSRPEFRRPRYIAYKARLAARMRPIRLCWMARGLVTLLALAADGNVHQCLSGSQPCALNMGSGLGVLLRLAQFLSSLVIPLLLAAIASYSVCAWSTTDYSGFITQKQASWVWPAGTVGVHPAQVLPPRLRVSPDQVERVEGMSPAAPSMSAPAVMKPASVSSKSGSGPLLRKYPDSSALLPPGPLRITILTIGTRGDVQPYIALAVTLKEAGHNVTISSTSDFKELVESHAIHFHDTMVPRIAQPPSWLTVQSVADMIRATAPSIVGPYRQVCREFYHACTLPVKCDVIVGTAMTVTFALSISEAISTPTWIAKLAPDLISNGFTSPGYELSKVGWVNKLKCYAYWIDVAKASTDVGVNTQEDAWRVEELGLGPVQARARIADMQFTPQLLGFSKHIFPKPTDYPAWAFQTGFWQMSEAEEFDKICPAPLQAFMRPRNEKGHRVYVDTAVVTFGSMVLSTREHFLADIVAELLLHNYRVLVLTGWADHPKGVPSSEENPSVLCWKEAPHDWVFKEATLVVHHGGAGTTGRALASGVPSIIIPVLRFADQMQWGQLVHDLRVGVVIKDRDPSRQLIRQAVQTVRHGNLHRAPFSGTIIGDRANSLGALVRAETSAESACAALEACLCSTLLAPADADAIHPLASPLLNPESLTAEQRMCVRHCVPCSKLRAMMQLADTSSFRTAPYSQGPFVESASKLLPASRSPHSKQIIRSPSANRKLNFSETVALGADAAPESRIGSGARNRRRKSGV